MPIDSWWQEIKGAPGYWVHADGTVMSMRFGKERVLKQNKDNKGYHLVGIRRNGKFVTQKVHRLVAEAFCLNTHRKKSVNHKDGNKGNNCWSNLEWVTNKENTDHGIENGLIPSIKGESNPKVKLSQEDVDAIRKGYDGVNRRYNKAMALKYNVTWHTIRNITRGGLWRNNNAD